MQSIKQFQNEQKRIYASVVSEPRQGLLMDIWNGQVQSDEDMMQVLDYSLVSIKDHNLTSWLAEINKLDALFEIDPESAEEYLCRHLACSSLCKLAFIHRSNKMRYLDRITRVLKEAGIEVRIFSTSVMAMQWLLLPVLVSKSMPVLEL